jgi:hypothetical protein
METSGVLDDSVLYSSVLDNCVLDSSVLDNSVLDSSVLDNSVLDNSVLLRLRKVTVMRQLKADHSLTVKATKPNIWRNIQR